jgi:calcineurin-like phosphoesterase family protein
MIYFTSDLHFGHQNIIKYCDRPWATSAEMDLALVKNWNNVVSNDDTVWVLGDISLSGKYDYIANLVGQLKGNKRLVFGNHDRLKVKDYYNMGFEFVSKYPVILKDFIALSHAPLFTNTNSPFFNVYGHVHNMEQYITRTEHSLCVCVERHNYAPTTLDIFEEA